MAAISLARGQNDIQDIGSTPPWLRGTAAPTNAGAANGSNYSQLASAMTGIRSANPGAMSSSLTPMGGESGGMGWSGGTAPDTNYPMGGVAAPSSIGAMGAPQSGSGSANAGGVANLQNAQVNSSGAPQLASGAAAPSSPGSMGGPGAPTNAGSGTGSSALQPANDMARMNDVRSDVERAYNAASGVPPSASSSMAKSASAPVASTTLPQAISDPRPPTANPILDSYMRNGGGPTAGATNPAATAVMGSPVTPSALPSSANATPNGPTPSPNGPNGTPANPGVTLGSQQAYAGGPNVTTSRVSYDGLNPISTDFSGDAQRAADTAYKGATQFFDTDFGHANSDLQSQLAAQGFAPGTQGYDRQMELLQRGQNAARTQAASQAQQVGFQQSGDLMQRALAARQQGVSERNSDADRTYQESLGVAGLGLGARGQDLGLQGAQAGASATMGAAGVNAAAGNYRADLDSQLGLRQLGLQQDNQDWSHALTLAGMGQNGVPGLNFGPASPLDVGGAYGIASGNNNAALNRGAANTNALYTLGGNLLGSYLRGP